MNPFSMPNLPTDNLYKFYALSGIVIILFSFTGLVLLQMTYDREIDLLNESKAILSLELSFMDEDLAELKGIIEKSEKGLGINSQFKDSSLINKGVHLDTIKRDEICFEEINSLGLSMEYQNLSRLEPSESESYITKLIKIHRKSKLKLAKINHSTDLLKTKINEYRKVLCFFSIVIFIGLALSIKGFKLWQIRVQNLLDRKLEIELNLLENELAKMDNKLE